MLLNGGELDGVRLLSPKTVELMTTNHLGTLYSNGNFGFGLGFEITEHVGRSGRPGSVGEFGWGGAYDTKYWVDPEEKLVVVYMTQLMPQTGIDVTDRIVRCSTDRSKCRARRSAGSSSPWPRRSRHRVNAGTNRRRAAAAGRRRRPPALLGLRDAAAAAGRGDRTRCSPAATASWCCRPAAASRSASRCRPWSATSAGVALVVSPLIALMKDQVDGLVASGVPAVRLDSSDVFSDARQADARHACDAGELPACSTSRPSGWWATAAPASRRASPAGRRALHRRRRGALHQPLGPRLPPGVPAARRAPRSGSPDVLDARLHGDGDGAGARRHRPPARAARRRSCSSAASIGRT